MRHLALGLLRVVRNIVIHLNATIKYSNNKTSLAISTLASWCHVVHSRDVSPHKFDGLAMSWVSTQVMSGLAISVATSLGVAKVIKQWARSFRRNYRLFDKCIYYYNVLLWRTAACLASGKRFVVASVGFMISSCGSHSDCVGGFLVVGRYNNITPVMPLRCLLILFSVNNEWQQTNTNWHTGMASRPTFSRSKPLSE